MSQTTRLLVSSALLVTSALLVLIACGGGGSSSSEPPADISSEFFLFESGQVRPLALSPDGTRLFAVNTPDNRLEIFRVTPQGLTPEFSVPVGMEPVAVAARSNAEVWVVNHLSDSVSIVDVSGAVPVVKRTLQVGDEPSDIVFAGATFDRAFITTAHRGQNVPFDPQFDTEGVGRADVWVFDADDLGSSFAGDPLTIIQLFGDTPRPLAVSPDGTRVYAGIFRSGNRTTVVQGGLTADSPDALPIPLNKPSPSTGVDSVPEPITPLIVKYNGTNWTDDGNPLTGETPKIWNDNVNFNLPDYDVFVIDAVANVPKQVNVFAGVGTVLFNMVVNPNNGNLYVTNTEARNHVRFEGSGSNSTTVNGHFVENRITVVDGSAVNSRHLNKHITSYNQPLGTAEENALSMALPMGMAISGDGATLYMAAFGSSKIAIFDTAELENDTFAPAASSQIPVSGGGPSGVILDEVNGRLYALTRFDNSIAIIDTIARQEIGKASLFNPEPRSVIEGRPFLYDASFSSSRGDSSCAGCHIFGDMDQLAWDLGNPDGAVVDSPNPYSPELLALGVTDLLRDFFHPLKGPMTTQSLRGMKGNGPMHWRGDRTGASRDSNESVEEQAFEDFNVAFVGLLGRAAMLSDAEMQKFTDFALQITYPPNPVRNLDNSLTTRQALGKQVFVVEKTNAGGRLDCEDCHKLNVSARQFGTSGFMSIEGNNSSQDVKIPHLRNLYQKVGMFAYPGSPSAAFTGSNSQAFAGDQIRGFGYSHSGHIDSLRNFMLGNPNFDVTDAEGEQINEFLLAFDSEMAPVVGQQVTVDAGNANAADVLARLDLLIARGLATQPRTECDLIFKGRINNESRGGVLLAAGTFKTDREADGNLTRAAILQLTTSANAQLTFTCAPPGSGTRMGIDRDRDGVLDGDES